MCVLSLSEHWCEVYRWAGQSAIAPLENRPAQIHRWSLPLSRLAVTHCSGHWRHRMTNWSRGHEGCRRQSRVSRGQEWLNAVTLDVRAWPCWLARQNGCRLPWGRPSAPVPTCVAGDRLSLICLRLLRSCTGVLALSGSPAKQAFALTWRVFSNFLAGTDRCCRVPRPDPCLIDIRAFQSTSFPWGCVAWNCEW